MNQNKIFKVCKKAIKTFGASMQELIAIEEMAELTKELIKKERGLGDIKKIQNEIADVEIMVTQLRMIYDPERIDQIKAEKILRLIQNINEVEKVGGI